MAGVLDRAVAHYAPDAMLSTTVPEWGEGGVPLVVYFHRLTLADIDRLAVDTRRGADARLVIRKALDAEGAPLFTVADEPKLTGKVDPWVVKRLALDIVTRSRGPTPAARSAEALAVVAGDPAALDVLATLMAFDGTADETPAAVLASLFEAASEQLRAGDAGPIAAAAKN